MLHKFFSSRDGGIRTHDLQHPMLARYRATLHPEKATVGNKETLLLRPINADSYIGTIDLTGLSQGTLQVKDAMDNIETKTQNFTYDLLPTITVISPVKNESFRQSKIHIKATATDPGSATCIGRVEYGKLEFNFVNSADVVDMGNNLFKSAAIRVYNSSSSKEVFNRQYTDQSGKINISLKDLAAGVYIVRLTVDNKEPVYKVVKM
jgi:hypothetical protein